MGMRSVGRPVEPSPAPVVYFGRADGRLAIWSTQSGGVLLDGQAVGRLVRAAGEHVQLIVRECAHTRST